MNNVTRCGWQIEHHCDHNETIILVLSIRHSVVVVLRTMCNFDEIK